MWLSLSPPAPAVAAVPVVVAFAALVAAVSAVPVVVVFAVPVAAVFVAPVAAVAAAGPVAAEAVERRVVEPQVVERQLPAVVVVAAAAVAIWLVVWQQPVPGTVGTVPLFHALIGKPVPLVRIISSSAKDPTNHIN